jgi:glucosamine--fructose-6-phosphate aminotransferase (isomerizing)
VTNTLVEQVRSLPALVREVFDATDEAARMALDHNLCLSAKRLFVAGCGDSHHAALGSELAFETLAGLPAEPMTAMQFARYAAGCLPPGGPNMNLFIGISVSGEVARTLEALTLARQAGAATLALTATPGSRLAHAADRTLDSSTPPFPDPPGVYTPRVRTYLANQLALLLVAVRLGEVRGHLDWPTAQRVRREIASLGDRLEATAAACDEPARALAAEWHDAGEFVFLGSGPNYGTALYSAAKVLEASGDTALGQDTEEWAHLQYFARAQTTPTFVISAGERDLSRAAEVAAAATALGRRVAAVAPASAALGQAAARLPLAEGVPEMFSPIVAAIPGALFAAYRAEAIGEPYFRPPGGGRESGSNRIRTSEMVTTLPR